MIAVDLDVSAIAIAMIGAASTVTVGILAYLGVKISATYRKVDTATTRLETKNGKDIGETVHYISEQQDQITMNQEMMALKQETLVANQEAMKGQIITNTKELVDMGAKIVNLDDKVNEHVERTRLRDAGLDPFFEEIRSFMRNARGS